MKNFWKKLAFMMIIFAVAFINISQAKDDQSNLFPQEIKFNKLLETLKIDKSQVDLHTVFEENEGQNLYLAAYQAQQIIPLENITDRLSKKYKFYNYDTKKSQNLSKEQIRTFLITGIIDPSVTGQSQESMKKALNNIQDRINQELEIENLRNDLQNYIFTKEIFVDGDTNNSGFDLVYDLEVIESILFNKIIINETELEGSSSSKDLSAPEFVKIASELVNSASEATGTLINKNNEKNNQTSAQNRINNKTNYEDSKSAAETNQADSSDQNITSQDSDNQSYNDPNLNSTNTISQASNYQKTNYFDPNKPNSCFEDSTLKQAFENFQMNKIDSNDEDQNENHQNNQEQEKISPTGEPMSTTTTPSSDESPTTSAKTLQAAFDNIKAKTDSNNWNFVLPCGTHFCLKISFQNNDDQEDKKDSSTTTNNSQENTNNSTQEKTLVYQQTDNCIACHIQFILKTFEDLSNHSLVPNKVTGNILEAPKCKKAFENVSPGLNVTMIKQPITSPLDDNLISNTPDFKKQLKDIYSFNEDSGEEPSPPLDQNNFSNKFTKAEEKLLSTEQLSLESAGNALIKLHDEIEFQIANKKEQQPLEVETQATADNYKALGAEMSKMNSYFSSFFKMINQINTGENACPALLNKKYCS
ncbi:MAG: hypothetical protein UR28_C0001G0057 [Candidatus Peregrinibacteria bacterium GW2011_GWF2_33_10]|nr:MAG: hypothetical protein UR28_C0001G0057 [Candidatus Peregrinibacteria bacterium GW2011_GWF2_33_10]